jgi:hypothetical protein
VPNALRAVAHRYLADRGALAFLTDDALTFRIQENDDGFSLVLNGTRIEKEPEETISDVRSPLIRSIRPQQLGEDLVVRVALTKAAKNDAVEVRSRQSHDPVRSVHTFALDFVPADGGVESVHRAKAALARIRTEDVTGCSLVYERSLRERLDIADLARALSVDGSFTDPYLREAMKRLGQLSDNGVITLTDGSQLLVSAPIELMAAVSRSPEAIGYLAVLRRFIEGLEPPESRRQALRGLIAPELSAARFDAIADAAENDERQCRASGAS